MYLHLYMYMYENVTVYVFEYVYATAYAFACAYVHMYLYVPIVMCMCACLFGNECVFCVPEYNCLRPNVTVCHCWFVTACSCMQAYEIQNCLETSWNCHTTCAAQNFRPLWHVYCFQELSSGITRCMPKMLVRISQILPHSFQKTNLNKHLSLHAKKHVLFFVGEIPKLNENMFSSKFCAKKNKNLHVENWATQCDPKKRQVTCQQVGHRVPFNIQINTQYFPPSIRYPGGRLEKCISQFILMFRELWVGGPDFKIFCH